MQHATALSSGRKTASAALTTNKALLTGLMVETDGTNAATVIVYDNGSAASGTVLAKIIVPGASSFGAFLFPVPVRAVNGLYLSISGTGAAAIVHYA